ncbi:MASE1 sensor histidine kinase, partial [Corallococcus coralloides]|nr:MASE1 sensor histidine kinase [Corallococcus coralloides]
QQGDGLYLEVRDNGSGLGPQNTPGFGMQGIRERVHALGGELTLESRGGTRVIVNLPTFSSQTLR